MAIREKYKNGIPEGVCELVADMLLAGVKKRTDKRRRKKMSNRTAVLYPEIEKIVNEEVCWAVENRGEYKNLHEAYTVLLEKIDEADDEMCLLYQDKAKLWQDTKEQLTENAHADAHAVLKSAMRTAAELVQTAAAAKKILRMTQEACEHER